MDMNMTTYGNSLPAQCDSDAQGPAAVGDVVPALPSPSSGDGPPPAFRAGAGSKGTTAPTTRELDCRLRIFQGRLSKLEEGCEAWKRYLRCVMQGRPAPKTPEASEDSDSTSEEEEDEWRPFVTPGDLENLIIWHDEIREFEMLVRECLLMHGLILAGRKSVATGTCPSPVMVERGTSPLGIGVMGLGVGSGLWVPPSPSAMRASAPSPVELGAGARRRRRRREERRGILLRR